jgi:hypothetical protein
MGRLISALGGLIVYLCVGTIITQLIVAGYAYSKGFLNQQTLADMLAVARGAPLSSDTDVAATAQPRPAQMMSIEELDERRAERARNLELREQAVAGALDQIATERDKLLNERQAFDLLVAAFRQEQQDTQERKLAEGQEQVRAMLESIKPKDAKVYILKMIDDDKKEDVVTILTAMPIAKQKKIIEEFKTEEERRKFYDILRLVQQSDDVGPTGATSRAPTVDAPTAPSIQQP